MGVTGRDIGRRAALRAGLYQPGVRGARRFKGGGGSAPTPPDPQATAAAQAAANREAAITQQQLNMIDQVTPWGTLTYQSIGGQPQFNQQAYDAAMQAWQQSQGGGQQQPAFGDVSDSGYQWSQQQGGAAMQGGQGAGAMGAMPNPADFYTQPGVDRWQAVTQLSPEQQRLYDLTTQAGERYGMLTNQQLEALQGLLSQPIDLGSLGAAPVANEETRQATADAMMGRLQPQMQADRQRLEARLANQGLRPGSVAYNRALDALMRSETDARLAVDAAAGSEMARLFGLEGAARDRAVNEMVLQRSQPLNELAAMFSGSQVQAPQFAPTPQAGVAAPNVMDAIYANYQGQLNQWNQQQQRGAQRNQGLFGLLGAGANIAASTYGGGGWTF